MDTRWRRPDSFDPGFLDFRLAGSSVLLSLVPRSCYGSDTQPFLWVCPGLHMARIRHLRSLGCRGNLRRWTHGPLHRPLLDFFQEAGLYLYT